MSPQGGWRWTGGPRAPRGNTCAGRRVPCILVGRGSGRGAGRAGGGGTEWRERSESSMATLTCERTGIVSGRHFCTASHARAQLAHLQGAGRRARAAAAAGARHRRTARRGGRSRAAAGAGARDGRVGSKERGMPECCGVSVHVIKFGVSRDAGFFPLFQLEFTSMLSRTPHPSPRPPFLSPLVAPTPTTPAVPPLPPRAAASPRCRARGSPAIVRWRIFLRFRFYASGRLSLTSLYASTIFVRTSAGAFV